MQSTPRHIISGRKSATDGIVVSTIFVFAIVYQCFAMLNYVNISYFMHIQCIYVLFINTFVLIVKFPTDLTNSSTLTHRRIHFYFILEILTAIIEQRAI